MISLDTVPEIRYTSQVRGYKTIDECMLNIVRTSYPIMSPFEVTIHEMRPIKVRGFVRNREWIFKVIDDENS